MRKQRHRGKHSKDLKLFGEEQHENLKHAAEDLALLLNRGYNDKSALKLVGDRYKLTGRQRRAILRISGNPLQIKSYRKREVDEPTMENSIVNIDGFNLLIFVEALLSNGYIFKALDGIPRDIASVHGSYKKVEETIPALKYIADALESLHIKEAIWYLDAPVSNSGRLKNLIEENCSEYAFNTRARVVRNPDQAILERVSQISVSSDRLVLEYAQKWFNLNGYLVARGGDHPFVIDLGLEITKCE